jgi:PEP-CTERM motif
MKTVLFAGLASLMTVVAAPASAATFNLGVFGGSFSTSYGNSSNVAGVINDTFNFTTTTGGASGSVISVAQTGKDIVLTSVKLDGISFTQSLTGTTELWQLLLTNIASGPHAITVQGNWDTGGGSYGGQLDFNVTSSVPEPATWGLMLVGFGVAGAALRSRRNALVARIA